MISLLDHISPAVRTRLRMARIIDAIIQADTNPPLNKRFYRPWLESLTEEQLIDYQTKIKTKQPKDQE